MTERESATALLTEIREQMDIAATAATRLVARLTGPPPSTLVKECPCGLAYTDEAWRALGLLGDQHTPIFVYELRNCTCRSTISRVRRLSEECLAMGPSALHEEIVALTEQQRELEAKQEWSAVSDVEDELTLLRDRYREIEQS